VVEAGRKLLAQGAKAVLVKLGADGSLLLPGGCKECLKHVPCCCVPCGLTPTAVAARWHLLAMPGHQGTTPLPRCAHLLSSGLPRGPLVPLCPEAHLNDTLWLYSATGSAPEGARRDLRGDMCVRVHCKHRHPHSVVVDYQKGRRDIMSPFHRGPPNVPWGPLVPCRAWQGTHPAGGTTSASGRGHHRCACHPAASLAACTGHP
jgi:hypothetical protein